MRRKRAHRAYREYMSGMVLCTMLARIALLPVLLFLLELTTDFALRYANFSYVTQRDLARFLIQPASLLAYGALMLVWVLGTCLETAAFTGGAITAGAGHFVLSDRVTLGFRAFFRSKKGLTGRIFSAIALSLLPNFYLLIQAAGHIHFFSPTFAWFEKNSWGAAGVALLSTLAGGLIFPAMRCLMGRRGGWKKAYLRSCGFALTWNGIAWLLYQAVHLILLLAMSLLLNLFAPQEAALSMALVYADAIDAAQLFLWSVFSVPAAFWAVDQLSQTREEHLGMDRVVRPSSRPRRVLALSTAAALLISAGVTWDTVRNSAGFGAMLGEIEITSHRGGASAPENTLESIERAIDELADRVELDVRMTSDGEIVLLHDTSLLRTTGEPGDVWNRTYEEIALLDAGSAWQDYENVRIPTLREALELCKGRINVNLDVKYHAGDKDLIAGILSLIFEFDMEEQCCITSTYAPYLQEVRAQTDRIRTGLILSSAIGRYYDLDYVDFLSVQSSFLSHDSVRKIQGAGKAVHAWTVNVPHEITRMKNLGVDGIITDYPLLCRERVSEDETTESVFDLMRMLVN